MDEIRLREEYTLPGTHVTALILNIQAGARQCSLSTGGWPTVRLFMADGRSYVAKAFSMWAPQMSHLPTPFVQYESRNGKIEGQVAVLGRGRAAWALLFLNRMRAVARETCSQVTSLIFFTIPVALGGGKRLGLQAPLPMCTSPEAIRGEPRTLMYLAGSPSQIRTFAARALAVADARAPFD